MSHEEITNLALRRAIFFPSAEIYPNSPGGFWEFGPIGTKIRNKVLDVWRKELVQQEDFEEIFGAQILPEKVFEASGHLQSFNDPIVQCKKCHSLYRADKLIEDQTKELIPESLTCEDFDRIINGRGISCNKCKSKEFEKVRKFNMMMGLDIGATGEIKGYLRPETCQNIFLDFQRVYKVSRKNLPLGIAQAGSAFRNEIAPRNTLLRERELGQMEAEIFFNPKKIDEIDKWNEIENYELGLVLPNEKEIKRFTCRRAVAEKIVSGRLIAYYLARVQQLYEKYGFPLEKMRFRGLVAEERAFYAKETWDFEVLTSLGWIELIANNYRGDHDLLSHLEGSGTDLSVNEDGEKFIPHVFEISAGIDRTVYAILDNSFKNEKRGQDERIYLSMPARVSPYHIAIFPLVKKDGIAEKAVQIKKLLEKRFDIVYDEKGSIGRRYARVDEIGIPFAITVDYQTMEDGTVTLRKRDDMGQERIEIEKIAKKIEGIFYD
ncbi:MAG: glycine--tRNA ligase [Candidatus Micrarchaeia archaeon]